MIYNSCHLIGQPNIKLRINDIKYLIILTIIGSCVRLYMIDNPSSPVYHENYLGRKISNYIRKELHISKYPPYSIMLYILTTWVFNCGRKFNFQDINKTYLNFSISYTSIRLFSVIFGIFLIPVTFLTLRIMKFTRNTAIFGSMLIIFENSIITQNRFLFVDSLALFFIALTHLFWRLFESYQLYSFKKMWWIYLIATGFALGALISTKWLGIFTLIWIGFLACLQLWHFIGDLTMTPTTWIKHFFSRVLCLIIVPILFYITTFYFHINYLENASDNLFLSPEFLSTLSNRNIKVVPSQVHYGSKVTIRHLSSPGGYLHSHLHLYPSGSKQQQITLYLYEDSNNDWLITDSGHDLLRNSSLILDGFILMIFDHLYLIQNSGHDLLRNSSLILDGSIIRLYHLETDKRLHSHDIRPSISDTEWQNEVSAYGYKGFAGDNNDLFKVEIDKSRSYTRESKINVRAIETKFRLIHVSTGCALFSNNINLPEWGYNQIEVTCAKNGIIENSLWYIENNSHDDFPDDIEKVTYKKIGFFQKFWELQKSIWKEKFESANSYVSNNHPASWPLLKRGVSFWVTNNGRIYFLGNPLIWWSTSIFIGIYSVLKIFSILRLQRGYSICNDKICLKYDYLIGTTLIGWIFHYFPFYFMKTQFVLHHYIPSLYFSIISFCSFWDFISTRFFQKSQTILFTLFFLKIVISVYFILAPLIYGSFMKKEHCDFIKFFKTWDLNC
ncbi:hypothetical protein PORY_000732 [Pneumocystis oryctolagi]|uniref:Uncharacterized protein n=1 Tax=Pneumocystis oryctolagi TaxID=42067 RepID=A0ACB7CDI4_9ASCO|nr:hypothetical protein PORY_000732 [Pneumocystis oryctolagi]